MQLSELKGVLGAVLVGEAHEIQSFTMNQQFGYVDKAERVAFAGFEYAIEMHTRPEQQTVAPALIWDDFATSKYHHPDATRYHDRKAMCLKVHDAIRGAGYILVSAVHHTHTEGSMVRCEYYKAAGDGYTGTMLRAVYTPNDYMPDGAIVIRGDHGRPDPAVYYTVGYEEGQITSLGANEFDGRPNRSIVVSEIESGGWKGHPMDKGVIEKELAGFDIRRAYSKTLSESPEGWRRTYIAELDSKELVQIVVINYHWSSDQGL